MPTYWNKISLGKSKTKKNKKIDSIGIGLASPEEIRRWGERRLPNGTIIGKVDKDHTVDYESLKPIQGGLFCERIFGPVEDFYCSCERRGEKNEKFCPNCEVEFTKSRVRRIRMGYIPLAVPVVHVWYLRGRPSYIANLIGKSRNAVDKLAYGETFSESFVGNSHQNFFQQDILTSEKNILPNFINNENVNDVKATSYLNALSTTYLAKHSFLPQRGRRTINPMFQYMVNNTNKIDQKEHFQDGVNISTANPVRVRVAKQSFASPVPSVSSSGSRKLLVSPTQLFTPVKGYTFFSVVGTRGVEAKKRETWYKLRNILSKLSIYTKQSFRKNGVSFFNKIEMISPFFESFSQIIRKRKKVLFFKFYFQRTSLVTFTRNKINLQDYRGVSLFLQTPFRESNRALNFLPSAVQSKQPLTELCTVSTGKSPLAVQSKQPLSSTPFLANPIYRAAFHTPKGVNKRLLSFASTVPSSGGMFGQKIDRKMHLPPSYPLRVAKHSFARGVRKATLCMKLRKISDLPTFCHYCTGFSKLYPAIPFGIKRIVGQKVSWLCTVGKLRVRKIKNQKKTFFGSKQIVVSTIRPKRRCQGVNVLKSLSSTTILTTKSVKKTCNVACLSLPGGIQIRNVVLQFFDTQSAPYSASYPLPEFRTDKGLQSKALQYVNLAKRNGEKKSNLTVSNLSTHPCFSASQAPSELRLLRTRKKVFLRGTDRVSASQVVSPLHVPPELRTDNISNILPPKGVHVKDVKKLVCQVSLKTLGVKGVMVSMHSNSLPSLGVQRAKQSFANPTPHASFKTSKGVAELSKRTMQLRGSGQEVERLFFKGVSSVLQTSTNASLMKGDNKNKILPSTKVLRKYNKFHTLPLFSNFVYKEWSHRFSFLEYFIWSAQNDDLPLPFYGVIGSMHCNYRGRAKQSFTNPTLSTGDIFNMSNISDVKDVKDVEKYQNDVRYANIQKGCHTIRKNSVNLVKNIFSFFIRSKGLQSSALSISAVQSKQAPVLRFATPVRSLGDTRKSYIKDVTPSANSGAWGYFPKTKKTLFEVPHLLHLRNKCGVLLFDVKVNNIRVRSSINPNYDIRTIKYTHTQENPLPRFAINLKLLNITQMQSKALQQQYLRKNSETAFSVFNSIDDSLLVPPVQSKGGKKSIDSSELSYMQSDALQGEKLIDSVNNKSLQNSQRDLAWNTFLNPWNTPYLRTESKSESNQEYNNQIVEKKTLAKCGCLLQNLQNYSFGKQQTVKFSTSLLRDSTVLSSGGGYKPVLRVRSHDETAKKLKDFLRVSTFHFSYGNKFYTSVQSSILGLSPSTSYPQGGTMTSPLVSNPLITSLHRRCIMLPLSFLSASRSLTEVTALGGQSSEVKKKLRVNLAKRSGEEKSKELSFPCIATTEDVQSFALQTPRPTNLVLTPFLPPSGVQGTQSKAFYPLSLQSKALHGVIVPPSGVRGLEVDRKGSNKKLIEKEVPNSIFSTVDTQQFPRLAELLQFTGGTALRHLLSRFDLILLGKFLRHELKNVELKVNNLLALKILTYSQGLLLGKLAKRRSKQIRRLKLLELFQSQKSNPEWMILSVLPVLPPDLRPILRVNDDFVVASDLNRLYQTVLRRNNTIHERLDDPLPCPESGLFRQRSLQKAVDGLLENGKGGGTPLCASKRRPLVSLSHVLKGKKGLFRQHLLGKRVDYSGRSVIVVGPKLHLHECGLPKEMAMELFQPFLLHRLKVKGLATSNTIARRMIQQEDPVIWHILKQLVYEHPVLLNRAPTLHRLGIQAFQPRLVSGRAILLHPLVCNGFNADFDGDQMAVHVPLSFQARAEAWKIMWSKNNLLSPATGQPILVPSQDMVLGCYYLSVSVPRVLSFLTPTISTVDKNSTLISSKYPLHLNKLVSRNELHLVQSKALQPKGGKCTKRQGLTNTPKGVSKKLLTQRAVIVHGKNSFALTSKMVSPRGLQSEAFYPLSLQSKALHGVSVPPLPPSGVRELEVDRKGSNKVALTYTIEDKKMLGGKTSFLNKNKGHYFSNLQDSLLAYFQGRLQTHTPFWVRINPMSELRSEKSRFTKNKKIETSCMTPFVTCTPEGLQSEALHKMYRTGDKKHALQPARNSGGQPEEILQSSKASVDTTSLFNNSLFLPQQSCQTLSRKVFLTPHKKERNELLFKAKLYPEKTKRTSKEITFERDTIFNFSAFNQLVPISLKGVKTVKGLAELKAVRGQSPLPSDSQSPTELCTFISDTKEAKEFKVEGGTCNKKAKSVEKGKEVIVHAKHSFARLEVDRFTPKKLTFFQPQYGSSREICRAMFQTHYSQTQIIIEGNETLEAPLELRLSVNGNLVKILTTFQHHYNNNATFGEQCTENCIKYMRTTAGRVVINKAIF